MNAPAAGSIKGQESVPATAGKKASRVLQQLAAQERRRMVIVSAGLFVLLGSGVLLAMMTDLPSALTLRTSLSGPRDRFGIEERSGSIVLPAANNRCRQIAFDNDTGRMVETNRPCETKPAVDDKGVQIPEATIRRLDSIRQGFAK